MKKFISLLLTIFMLVGLCSLPLAAEDGTAEAPEDLILKMYISDEGKDSNDGFTPETPKKTINNAVNYMKNHVSATAEYRSAELILVGDVTINTSYITYDHPLFALTVKSQDGSKHALKLNHNYRIGGETLFTNIKILTLTDNIMRGFLIADGHKLTVGQKGIENDVVTYESGVSNRPLGVVGGYVSWTTASDKIDVTLNCGEYQYISTGGFGWGSVVNGDINFVINDAKITNGVIAMGGGVKSKYAAMDDTGMQCTGDYNLVINGGTFTNTEILIGAQGTSSATGPRDVKVEGNTIIDINGGTFTNFKIATSSQLGAVADFEKVDFQKGITLDLVNIANDDKAAYVAMVHTGDIAPELTKNKITVVEHAKVSCVDVDDEKHKLFCPCGCDLEELVDHTYDNGTVTKQPTHATAGEKTYTCSVCAGTKTETIAPDANTHNYTTGWVKLDDEKHQKTCDDPACPDASKGAVVEAHNFGEPVVTKEATHTEEGVREYTCADCGFVKTEAIEKIPGHSMSEKWEYHDAEQHKRSCECGEAKYGAHTWNTGKVTKEATVESEGEKTYTCTLCKGTKFEVIPKLTPTTTNDSTEGEAGGCGATVSVGLVAFASVLTLGVGILSKKKED